MKTNHTRRNVLAYLLFAIVMVAGLLTSCKSSSDDPAPVVSKEDEVSALLTSATWKMSTVTVDGADKTSIYKDLKLTFTSTGFTSVNGGAVWPASGTWDFTSAEATAIKRNDGVEVTLQEVTDASLKLALIWNKNTLGPGRIESVSGQHVFSFGK